MMVERCESLTHLFDCIEHVWDHPKTQKKLAVLLLCIYLMALIGIEANREGLLPPWLGHVIPTSHFQSIQLAFTLILGMEMMELIISISGSLSKALGKQFEVMALILLRDAFKHLSHLPEPVSVQDPQFLLLIASSGLGALIIFICLGFYHRLRVHQNYITDPMEKMRYVMSKKLIALILVALFWGIALRDLVIFARTGADTCFFETIYTVLIFADIGLVLVAQRFMPAFHAVFRNSSFVIGTLLMRLALSAPWPWNLASSVFAAFYVLGVTWATGYFGPGHIKRGLPCFRNKV